MEQQRSIQELKARLEERREWHLRHLQEIEDGLSQFDRLVTLAYGPQEEPLQLPVERRVRVESPKAAKLAPSPKKRKAATEEDTDTARIEEFIRDREVFDMKIADEVNSRFGSNLTEKQASNALRNLLRSNKIKLIRAGAPRKPAIYAQLDYQPPTQEQPLFNPAPSEGQD